MFSAASLLFVVGNCEMGAKMGYNVYLIVMIKSHCL